jgi:hypothetical protein
VELKPINDWTEEEVRDWAVNIVGIGKTTAKKLLKNQITGVTTRTGFSDASPLLKAIKSVAVTPIPWFPDEWVQHLPEEEREEARKDPHMRIASLPDEFQWLLVISPNLFVRNCYNQMWQEIEKAFTTRTCNRVLILGNPGIGKTVSLNYILI